MTNSQHTRPLNVSYLVVGLVFLGIAGSWALREAGVVDLSEFRWLFPAMLVAAGLVGVVAMTAKSLSRRGEPGDDTHIYEGENR